MGSGDIFTGKRGGLKARKKEKREPKPNSFLIVSEGEKTEPSYFDGIADYINEKYGKSIAVEKPIIDICGEGKGTVRLVNEAAKLANRARIHYEQVWVVFDKDEFKDFDEAIQLAEDMGFKAAWSNQSFEYWIYLHFNYSVSALDRSDWVEKLNQIFKAGKIDPNGYEKNNDRIFEIVRQHGSLKKALERAVKIEEQYPPNMKPSQKDPCTTVYQLILALKPYMNELL